MKYLSDAYQKIITYDGFDICTLKVAIPSQDADLGYRIDDSIFFGDVFNCVEDAMKLISFIHLRLKEKKMFGDLADYINNDEALEEIQEEWKYKIACNCNRVFLPSKEDIERGETSCPCCGQVYKHF